MPILLGMSQTKTNQWDGQIYNSQDGHTYSASIRLLNPNALRVQGCFLGILCGGENWTRVDPANAPNGLQAQNAPQSPNTRDPAGTNQPPAADDICLRLFGPATGLPHERGLK
jgi:hypothetical protein